MKTLTINVSNVPLAILVIFVGIMLMSLALLGYFWVIDKIDNAEKKEKEEEREERKRRREAKKKIREKEEQERKESELRRREAEQKEKEAREAAQRAELEKKEMAERLKRVGGRTEIKITDDTILVGSDETPRGAVALGWLDGIDEETSRKTIKLETIGENDRENHFYIVGSSGSGKTKLIEYLIRQDIDRGAGFALIDPHGDLIDNLKIYLTKAWGQKGGDPNNLKRLASDVVLIDPTDEEKTACFNPLELDPGEDPEEQAAALAGGLTESFKKIWQGQTSWGVQLEDTLRCSLIALSEGGLTLADLPDFLEKDDFRRQVLSRVKNKAVLSAFEVFDRQSQAAKILMTKPVMNKIRGVLISPKIRQFFSQPKSTFNLREIMDGKKILLVSLPKGNLVGVGEMLGSILMSHIQLAAFSRIKIKNREDRVPFYLYIDEFQNFATDNFLSMLTEAFKFKLFLVLSHQTLAQLSENLQSSILGNSNIQAYFSVHYKDAEILARQSGERLIKVRHNHKELVGIRNAFESFEKGSFEKRRAESPDIIYPQPYELIGQPWGERRQQLQDLRSRQYVVKIRKEGALLVDAEIIPDPVKVYSAEELESLRKQAGILVGSAHMRKREDLKSEEQKISVNRGEREEPESFWVSEKKD